MYRLVSKHGGNVDCDINEDDEHKAALEALDYLGFSLAYCPDPYPRYKVVVEVRGGCAEVTTCPKSVEVKIIDHDNH